MSEAHAAKGMVAVGRASYPAAAGLLPPGRTVSLQMLGNDGRAWNRQVTCGVHPSGGDRAERRGVNMLRAPDGSYDGLLEIGAATTASPPAGPPHRDGWGASVARCSPYRRCPLLLPGAARTALSFV